MRNSKKNVSYNSRAVITGVLSIFYIIVALLLIKETSLQNFTQDFRVGYTLNASMDLQPIAKRITINFNSTYGTVLHIISITNALIIFPLAATIVKYFNDEVKGMPHKKAGFVCVILLVITSALFSLYAISSIEAFQYKEAVPQYLVDEKVLETYNQSSPITSDGMTYAHHLEVSKGDIHTTYTEAPSTVILPSTYVDFTLFLKMKKGITFIQF